METAGETGDAKLEACNTFPKLEKGILGGMLEETEDDEDEENMRSDVGNAKVLGQNTVQGCGTGFGIGEGASRARTFWCSSAAKEGVGL